MFFLYLISEQTITPIQNIYSKLITQDRNNENCTGFFFQSNGIIIFQA